MRYLFQRVAHNDLSWQRPSPGRLNSKLDNGYVSQHGFAHEDWHFSGEIANNGYIHGYSYYKPANFDNKFCIVFATYEGNFRWTAVGFFEEAMFDPLGAVYDKEITYKRADQLIELRNNNSIRGDYASSSNEKIVSLLEKDYKHYHWRLQKNNVIRCAFPITIPKAILHRKIGFHFSRPTEIDKNIYEHLKAYTEKFSLDRMGIKETTEEYDCGFPEGEEYYAKHKRYERSAKVVKLAKERFKKKYGRLFCEVCRFDFHATYGSLGENFIEAHHTVPVCEMLGNSETRPEHLMMLCANCHRMVHRYRPWQENCEKIKAAIKMLKAVQ